MRGVKFCLVASMWLPAWLVASEKPFEIRLWSGAAPGSQSSELKESYEDRPIDDGTNVERDRHVTGVTQPTITVHLPDAPKAKGAAVIVLPGGGFNVLAIDKEGHDVASWLNEQGVAGIVVKYRLPEPTEQLIRQYSPEQRVTSETPPTFLVHANDDGLSAEHSIEFYLALKRQNLPVEMHVYSRGGHGYGLRQRGLPLSSWRDRWLDWMLVEEIVPAEVIRP